jgi:hypothetical protein
MGSSGPSSTAAGLPGDGGDDLAGSRTAALRPANCSTAAGASRAHLGLAGPDGAWCAPAAMFGQRLPLEVEVGSSSVAVRLLFLVPTVSCISVVQVIG